MDLFASLGDVARDVVVFFAETGGEGAAGAEGGGEEGGLQINLFWILVAALNFLLFLAIIYFAAFRNIGQRLDERRARIEQGLRDADQARRDREQAAEQRQAVLTEARREANEIVTRAQRTADELRERELADMRGELERQREQAVAEIQAERQRALTDVRAQVADLALMAASRVVGETMNEPRERRLVEEFLAQVDRDGRERAPTVGGGA